jgi:pyridoxal phosphate enzyme (YggS family)
MPMLEEQSMKATIDAIQNRIRAAALAAGRRPESVRLVAVSKTVPAERVRAAVAGGAALLGENYIQEARQKIETLQDLDVAWHFIGHLQSNKAKYAVPLFDLIHSVDSLKLARELDKQAAKHTKVQKILIQVNTGQEASKSGVYAEEALALVRAAGRMEHLAVMGLMTLPPFFNAPEKVRPYFRTLRELRDRLRAEDLPSVRMDELSMGMTGDFEAAIQEGATLVRIGTAIFGERP